MNDQRLKDLTDDYIDHFLDESDERHARRDCLGCCYEIIAGLSSVFNERGIDHSVVLGVDTNELTDVPESSRDVIRRGLEHFWIYTDNGYHVEPLTDPQARTIIRPDPPPSYRVYEMLGSPVASNELRNLSPDDLSSTRSSNKGSSFGW